MIMIRYDNKEHGQVIYGMFIVSKTLKDRPLMFLHFHLHSVCVGSEVSKNGSKSISND